MKDFSTNSLHFTCSVCVAQFSIASDSNDCSPDVLTPHPHRWLSQEHPDTDCHGELIEIDLNTCLAESGVLSEIGDQRATAEMLQSTYEAWSEWSRREHRVSIPIGGLPSERKCLDCQAIVKITGGDEPRIAAHANPETSVWCRNSGLAITADNPLQLQQETDRSSTRETTFGGTLGEETAVSPLWQDPKSESKKVKTTNTVRKAKRQPDRNVLTPRDKAFYPKELDI